MPFSEHIGIPEEKWTEAFEHLFKPSIEFSGSGFTCERSELTNGAFTKEIVENLKKADLVLADITGLNGNVMWELGVRHALSPRTILVTRSDVEGKKYISDLSIYAVIDYTLDSGPKKTDEFKIKMKEILLKIKENPDKPDNPVYDFLKIEDLVMTSYDEKQKLDKFAGFMSELLENKRQVDILLEDGNVAPKFIANARPMSYALNNLLVSNYLHFDDDFLKRLFVYRMQIQTVNASIENHVRSLYFPNVAESFLKKKSDDSLEVIKDLDRLLDDLIPKSNKIMSLIKSGSSKSTSPKIISLDEKYKKLLDF